MFIYAALGGAGFLLLLVMLIAGGFGEHDVPIHEASLDHGDLDGHAGPSPLSTRVIGAFLTLFGVGGIVGQYLRWDHPASSACGLVLGLAGATLVHRFALLLHSQEAGSELHMSELVARPAQVTVAIPENGVGEVSLTVGFERTAQLARSDDGRAIPSGGEVVIKAVHASVVVVERKPTSSEGSVSR